MHRDKASLLHTLVCLAVLFAVASLPSPCSAIRGALFRSGRSDPYRSGGLEEVSDDYPAQIGVLPAGYYRQLRSPQFTWEGRGLESDQLVYSPYSTSSFFTVRQRLEPYTGPTTSSGALNSQVIPIARFYRPLLEKRLHVNEPTSSLTSHQQQQPQHHGYGNNAASPGGLFAPSPLPDP